MKKLMMAFAALCVAATASAITAKWTYNAEQHNSSPNGIYTSSTSLPRNFYVTITVGGLSLVGLQEGDNALALLGQWNGGDTRLSVNKGTSGELTLSTQGSRGQTALNYVSGADRTIANSDVITVAYNKNATGSNYGIEIYIGDTLIATRADANVTGLSFITKRDGTGDSAYDAVDGLIASAAVYEGIAPVPEPTALALLALGIAGLTLRRKVA